MQNTENESVNGDLQNMIKNFKSSYLASYKENDTFKKMCQCTITLNQIQNKFYTQIIWIYTEKRSNLYNHTQIMREDTMYIKMKLAVAMHQYSDEHENYIKQKFIYI